MTGPASAALAIVLGIAVSVFAGQQMVMQRGELQVLYDSSSRAVAREVAEAYPAIRAELEATFGWRPVRSPGVRVVLLKEAEFKKLVGKAPIVAFASSGQNLIVIDPLRAEREPDTFRSVLKHEVVHLYLGWYVGGQRLPRWLNEGVAQWASGGVSELLAVGRTTEIEKATLLGRLIPLGRLDSFPRDEKPLQLAYQESLSIVNYITDKYGREGLMDVLSNIRAGKSVEEAVSKSLGIEFHELEGNWHNHLKLRHTLLTYLSNNIYVILFVLGALISAYAFARVIIRIRTRRDDDEDEPTYPYW